MTISLLSVYASLAGDRLLLLLGEYANDVIGDTAHLDVCPHTLRSYTICDSAWDDAQIVGLETPPARDARHPYDILPWRGQYPARPGLWMVWLALDFIVTAIMGVCMSLTLLQSSRIVWPLQRPLVTIHAVFFASRQALWMAITAVVHGDGLVRLGFKFLSVTLLCHIAMLVTLRLLVLWADWIISRPGLLVVRLRLDAHFLEVTSVFNSLAGCTFTVCPLSGPRKVTVFRADCGHWFHAECIKSWAYHQVRDRHRRRARPRVIEVNANGDTVDENGEVVTARNNYCPVCATTPILKTRTSRVWFRPKLR
ncbi:hypothetical protein FOZ61_002670 [Perkinsus olseni]|uniref:Uncharacterized protein n=1 Tax=Perkinsus olseni TaxID=32597 RepID=A0A7J6LT74_PEROL|nr:hypothetical protein FOZ61_002670 [Perkinsus olseni]